MRTRSRSGPTCPSISVGALAWNKNVTPYQVTQTVYPFQGVPPYYWTLPNSYKTWSETMMDELGSDGSFRNCSHQFEANEFAADYREARHWITWATSSYPRLLTTAHISNSLAVRAAPVIDMSAYADQALAFMLPRLNEGTSLVNFILELKDLKHMNPMSSIHRLTRRHLPLKALQDPRTRDAFIKELTTRLVGAHLNASFGIVPFVGDLVRMHDELLDLSFRLEQLKRNVGRRLQRHYKRVIPESSGVYPTRDWVYATHPSIAWPSGEYSDTNTDPGGVRKPVELSTRARWILRPTYHATLRYSYSLPLLGDRLEKVYAYLDTLGVRLDPSIVWNAIPFSFTVDWLVDVSGFLSSFARDNYPINTIIHDFCHSYEWHKEAELMCAHTAEPNLPSPPYSKETKIWPVRVFKGTRTSYDRVVVKTHNIHSVTTRAPRLREAALAGSLLLSRTALGTANRYRDRSRLPNLGTNR